MIGRKTPLPKRKKRKTRSSGPSEQADPDAADADDSNTTETDNETTEAAEGDEEDSFIRKRKRNIQKTPCFITACDYNSIDYNGPARSTFFFPRWNRALLRRWMANIRAFESGKLTKWACICEAHFEPELVSMVGEEVFLDRDAVPTLFPDVDPDEVKEIVLRPLEKPKKIRRPTKRVCCYESCDYNSPTYYGPRRGLFRLPVKHPELLQQWLVAIGREGEDWYRPSTTLCAKHFEPDLISGRGTCFLLAKDAVPSIFE